MSFRWWPSYATRWFERGVSYLTPQLLHRLDLSLYSYLVPRSWDPLSLLRLPAAILSFPIVDNALWSMVTVFESIALASMLCSFYLLCGCTL
ncbi:hypothetical protein Nepgr_001628 [Nepenthes gracilis]|uniref:Uncharacterized protein n=1 Tax=Nepenthes gracilis TaxID=150966 RepID=A0AAD3P4S5_NEPGR|nr:hypothetical protein Nepgr_001628 [Nepenthes gracilis]